jgi:protein required for attachment to host cells
VAHHAVGGENRPHKHEAALFAKRIVQELEKAHGEEGFERVVLMAGPAFLGLLREALPKSLRAMVVAEVASDLVHQPEEAVQAHLPRDVFGPPA